MVLLIPQFAGRTHRALEVPEWHGEGHSRTNRCWEAQWGSRGQRSMWLPSVQYRVQSRISLLHLRLFLIRLCLSLRIFPTYGVTSTILLLTPAHLQDGSIMSGDCLCLYLSSWFILPFREHLRSNCQHLLDHQKSKRVPEKHLFLLYWLCQSLWLCGSQ